MRVITWNINSVRLREQQVLKVLKDHNPDVLCLQETKTPDEHFPFDNFKAAGYEHIHIHGMKGYNGVAILSKHPFEATDIHHRVGREDCRHISAKIGQALDLKSGFTVHNLYIPAGGDEPNPETNEKFEHKLNFVEEMTQWFKDNHTPDDAAIAVGDFNIAPHENDVWSHKQLLKVVSHTPPETERLEDMRKSLDWIDVARYFVADEDKCYSWWSYRNRDWKKSNRGRRLDHIWVTPSLKPALSNFEVYTEARDFEKPSDHVPVIVDLKD
jgi:exodeoxyribonuclease-3